jgi:hypothetical protein
MVMKTKQSRAGQVRAEQTRANLFSTKEQQRSLEADCTKGLKAISFIGH